MTRPFLSTRAFARSASSAALIALALLCAAPLASAQISLPVTFEDGGVNYELQDFGGNASMLVADPTDAGNTVVQSVRAADAACFAGTTVADVTGFDAPIPFTADMTTMSVRVWSPEAGVRVLWKVENVNDPTISVETVQFTTTAGAWETIVFDLGDERPGTAALNLSASYTKASIFFEFSCDLDPPPPATPERTYYWDDVEFGGEASGGGIALPVTFEDDIDYELQDFGGNASMLVADPTDAGNTVVQSVRAADAACFAGTTVANVTGFAMPIPFAPGATTMTVRVWSPLAGIPVRFKVEDVNDAGVSVEAEVPTTMAGMWETLTYDFTDQVPGTAEINFEASYTKASIFFDFSCPDPPSTTERTYYWDDVAFGGTTGGGGIALPITFEDDIDYELQDFGGNASMLVADPTDAENTVVQSVRAADAACFAGTTVGDVTGFTEPVPFAPGMTTMSVRVWAPEAGIRVLLKVEDVTDAGVSVETFATTTAAGEWETLVFDFADEAPGTSPINFEASYTKASIFFDFSCDLNPPPPASPERTYYWDDVEFGGEVVLPSVVSLPVTFEQDIDYELQDFGGNVSMLAADPTDAENTVVQTIRTAGAACFAGTTVANVNGFTEPVPFTPEETAMNVRVWSPEAGIRVLLKVEDVTDAGVSVETFATTTAAGEWETLVFDFADEAPGTSPINFEASYTKASIFFDFSCDLNPPPPASPERTYYWDDLAFGTPPAPVVSLPVTFDEDIDYGLIDFGGASSQIVPDPAGGSNMVVETVRAADAEPFAGTIVGGPLGLVSPVPFTESMTEMNLRVWAPAEGTAVRIKLENIDDPSVSVETQSMATAGGVWQTLNFDFAVEVPATPMLDVDAVYNRAVVFFDFEQDTGSEPVTYYWDDLEFGPAPVSAEGDAATVLALEQSFPNPLADRGTVRFSLPAAGAVRVELYNAIGQKVMTLVDAELAAGGHDVALDGRGLASGTYFYRMSFGSESLTRSLVVAR